MQADETGGSVNPVIVNVLMRQVQAAMTKRGGLKKLMGNRFVSGTQGCDRSRDASGTMDRKVDK